MHQRGPRGRVTRLQVFLKVTSPAILSIAEERLNGLPQNVEITMWDLGEDVEHSPRIYC